MQTDSGFPLSDIWGILRRRARLMGGVALVVFLASYWVGMALPNTYESYATVLVEPQSVDPGLVQAGVPKSDLNRRLHLMTAQILSRPRLSRIIDELGLYQNESESMVREEIIDLMRANVRVEPVLPELEQKLRRDRGEYEINTFRIYFRDDKARTTQVVAQRLANDFIEEHISERVKLSQKSLEFIEGELERLATRIREVEARVAAVKNENVGSLPEDVLTNQRRMERLVGELGFAQRAVAEAESDAAFWRSQSAAMSVDDGVRTNDDASPTRRAQLLELLLDEYEAKGFTEKHPDVQKAKTELAAIRSRLARQAEEGEEVEAADLPPSPQRQTAEAEIRRAQARAQSAQEEVARLRARIEEVQQLLAATPQVAEQLDALQREYEHLFRSYQDFSNRRLEATVQAQMERRQLGEQFRVLEAAFVPFEPTSPNRPLILLLGFVMALGAGVGLAVVLESVDSSVHTGRQLQASVRIPVLAEIPEILLESDRAAIRRRRIRTALASAALVIFAFVGGAANYVWVNGAPGWLSGAVVETGAQAGPAPQSPPAGE